MMRVWMGSEQKGRCSMCGSRDHLRKLCPELPCGFCCKTGHIILNCPECPCCEVCQRKGHKPKHCPSVRAQRPISVAGGLASPATVISSVQAITQNICPASQKQGVQDQPLITFPCLRSIFLSLIQFILSEGFGSNLSSLNKGYQDAIQIFESPEFLADILIRAVEPSIRDLQGCSITKPRLDQVREAQILTKVTWSKNSGYLDYVSDIRVMDYWRPYVGQSGDTGIRIPQHCRNIKAGETSSLHYFVIARGGGNRQANFIKLWHIEVPGNIDPSIIGMLSNFLEMGLCRAFQSLPPVELEKVFGPPSAVPGDTYAFIGLNLVSPLLQGRSLSPWIRHRYAIRLKDSSDQDIRAYADYRLKHNQSLQHNPRSRASTWTRLTTESCRAAIETTAMKHTSLNSKLQSFLKSLSRETRGNKIIDHVEWLASKLKTLSLEDKSFNACLPIGSSEAQFGIILSDTFIQSTVPLTLQECGFNETNVLLWTASFRQIKIGPGLRIGTRDLHDDTLKALNFSLISRSQVRIVLVADKSAERLLFYNNPTFKSFCLDIQDQTFEAWISTEDTPKCLYLSSEPLSVMLSRHEWKHVRRLTTLLRFSTFLLDLKNINPSACSSALAVVQIISRYDMERNGFEQMTADNIDPHLEEWLYEKGFTNSDIKRLEACANSLLTSLLILTFVRPKKENPQTPRSSVIANSCERRRDILNKEHLKSVTALFNEIKRRIPGDEHMHSGVKMQENSPNDKEDPVAEDDRLLASIGQQLLEIQTEFAQDRLEESVLETEGDNVILDVSNSYFPSEMIRGGKIPLDRSSKLRLQSQIRLFQGIEVRVTWNQGVQRFRFYAGKLEVYFAYTTQLQELYPEPSLLKSLIVKLELEHDSDTDHPEYWARSSTTEDPARRLGIRVTVSNDQSSYDFYCHCDQPKAPHRANACVDWFDGVGKLESARKPRRYFRFRGDEEHPGVPESGYTDKDGNIMTENPRKRKKRPGASTRLKR